MQTRYGDIAGGFPPKDGALFWGEGENRSNIGKYTMNADGSMVAVIEDKIAIAFMRGAVLDAVSIGPVTTRVNSRSGGES